MHDIKWIEENPQQFDEALQKRNIEPQAEIMLQLYQEKKNNITKLQGLQHRRNEIAKEIGLAKRDGKNPTELFAEAKQVKQEISEIEKNEYPQLELLLSSLPNILDDDVPIGKDENSNIELYTWGEKPQFNFTPKEHFDICGDLMDFKTAVKMSGSRFALLKGKLAQLERALANFMLDMHTKEYGYTEINPPFLVKGEALFGSGQLPKFEEDLFKTTDGLYLIPTGEVPLVNIVREEILNSEDLPLRFTAMTPCFRSEAGSAGKDTHGMIRQHQFSKVELISIAKPEVADKEFERMLSVAEEVLKRLNLHYRVVLLCSGDTGFTQHKTYDIEVWIPGQNKYREISSCSNCGEFQARRMKTRYKEDGKNHFVHTLNGSALAIGRTLIAILENYQNEDGSFDVPEVLKKWL